MTERAIYYEQDQARGLWRDGQIKTGEYLAFMRKTTKKLKTLR